MNDLSDIVALWNDNSKFSWRLLTKFNLSIDEAVPLISSEKAAKILKDHVVEWDRSILPSDDKELRHLFDSFKTLFSQGFAVYCSRSRFYDSGTQKLRARPCLDDACYWIWDRMGIDRFDFLANDLLIALTIDVFRDILAIDHIACQESALRGMGLIAYHDRELVRPIIQHEFLQRHRIVPELREYADAACSGWD